MRKQAISLEDKRRIQLVMLKEVDAFCRKNSIRYSLAFGTLLGAVRHKGFIPWDDDMDIMMPLPDMIRFKQEFKSDNVQYCDIDTQKYYSYSHSKLVDTHTYSQNGVILKGHGIDIDLYPILGLPQTEDEINVFFKKARVIMNKRLWLMKWRGRIIRRLPIKNIPLYSRYQRLYHDFLFRYPYGVSKYYFCYGGGLHWRNVYDFDIFEKLIDLPFEGEKFMAISCYDEFLTHFYGDYMTPPPENQRHPYHGGAFYWK